MLTTNDERWLEGRKVLCPRCDHYRDHVEGKSACFRGEKSGWMQAECRFFLRQDLIPDYKDAAKFEGIVAMLLTDPVSHRFRRVNACTPTRTPVCRVCKAGGFAKLDEEGYCVRRQLECRRMHAMYAAEYHCDKGTLPKIYNNILGDPDYKEEMPE